MEIITAIKTIGELIEIYQNCNVALTFNINKDQILGMILAMILFSGINNLYSKNRQESFVKDYHINNSGVIDITCYNCIIQKTP
jgi:hypothetical protein